MSDFVVSSNGYCFFCSGKITTTELDSASTHSIQYLSRYLKMKVGKVFNDDGQAPLELLDKVKKSRLKAQLCEECASLSEMSSDLYQKMEKLEMEMKTCLERIHGQFLKASEMSKTEERSKLTDHLKFNSDANMNGILKVVEVLRKEAIHKCTQKLTCTPRVKVENLSKKGIHRARAASNLRTYSKTFGKPQERESSETARLTTTTEFEKCDVKTELEYATTQLLSEDDDNISHFSDDYNSPGTIENAVETTKEDMDSNGVAEVGNRRRVVKKTLITFSPSITVQKQKVKWSLNPDTGKHKCDLCNRDFSSLSGCHLHFSTVHLKVRYKCVRCNKLFSQKSSLYQHQRTSCSGSVSIRKYKCHLCTKAFGRKGLLQVHLEGVHFKLQKYCCDICENRFTTKKDLAAHRKIHFKGA